MLFFSHLELRNICISYIKDNLFLDPYTSTPPKKKQQQKPINNNNNRLRTSLKMSGRFFFKLTFILQKFHAWNEFSCSKHRSHAD